MNDIIRRAFAAATVTVALGAGGFAAPASAHHSDLGCDPAVVAAAVDAAKTEARVAQKRFTSHTKSSMPTLVKKLKAHEKAEAKAADKKADRLALKATSSTGEARTEARAAAKAARTVARAEAKESNRIQRASFSELRKVVKADRKVLKAQWNAAKASLKELRVHADTCTEAPVEPESGDPVA
ncbi:hypothetical protein [Aeromicrobium sp.]|uniref:hypothetical protein n=1 Tax=Aeromicrobium sp. TaxID=1871063 RepID=UPI0019A14EF2|nr:hypothetical protein [Aeromicrobium sp.]MBC7631652.1 hypothetical protein [Aeromicrobium sp.]